MMDEDAADEVLDAGLIAAAQKVEHYEIAGYGCAVAYAKRLGEKKQLLKALEATLKEERASDQKPTKLAKLVVNAEAQKR